MKLDFREPAPAAASQDMYNDNINGSIRGGLASGIPGDLRGLEYLHKKHGVSSFVFLELYSVDDHSGTSMESCLQSCCSRCQKWLSRYESPTSHFSTCLNMSVTEDLVRYMQAGYDYGEFLVKDPQWAVDFAPNGLLKYINALRALTLFRYPGGGWRHNDQKTICGVGKIDSSFL